MRTWSSADERAVSEAMAATGVTDLSRRLVDELSGGQRQRVWVAMALAQQTKHLLLDEPTTFLDIAHQIDLMELFADLHRDGTTLVAVLHDLNQCRPLRDAPRGDARRRHRGAGRPAGDHHRRARPGRVRPALQGHHGPGVGNAAGACWPLGRRTP